MSKMIQIRNVPDGVHRRLKAKAAAAGMSLSDYLLQEVTELSGLLTWDEITARLAKRPPRRTDFSAVDVIRAARDAADSLPPDASTVEIIRATRDAADHMLQPSHYPRRPRKAGSVRERRK